MHEERLLSFDSKRDCIFGSYFLKYSEEPKFSFWLNLIKHQSAIARKAYTSEIAKNIFSLLWQGRNNICRITIIVRSKKLNDLDVSAEFIIKFIAIRWKNVFVQYHVVAPSPVTDFCLCIVSCWIGSLCRKRELIINPYH